MSTWGLLAEFKSEEEIMAAAKEVNAAGFRKWDCHVPHPVHGLDKAMGVKATILPWLVLAGGLTGATLGYTMQYWMNAVDYPFLISGKPLHSGPSMIPVTFEVTILFSAFTAFFGNFALNGLPRFFNPLFRSDRFRRATNDRFFVAIETADPQYSAKTRDFLQSLGASHVEEVPA
ncbi:MAG: DUF3341 domain-containing protein [Planctomycetota bacterium]